MPQHRKERDTFAEPAETRTGTLELAETGLVEDTADVRDAVLGSRWFQKLTWPDGATKW